MAEAPLSGRIKELIGRHGPLAFSDFMNLALYDPDHGFYMGSRRRAGRGEDFVTSPTCSTSFGRTLARLVPRLHAAMGGPPGLRLVDAGGGAGELLKPLAARARELVPEVALEAVLVERGHGRRSLAEASAGEAATVGVLWRWVAECRELGALAPMPGLVVANELFDSLPVRRLRRGREVEELYVDVVGGHLVSVWRTAATVDLGGRRLPRSRESTLAVGVEELMRALSSAVSRGLLLVIDYGSPARILDAPDGPGSPARGFRAGALVDDLLASPGEVDLTASVDFSRVDRAAVAAGWERLLFTDQYQLLLALGFLEDPDAVAAKRLIHPEDMGGAFKCLLLGKGVETAALSLSGARDRSRLL